MSKETCCHNCPKRAEGCHSGCPEHAVERIVNIIHTAQIHKKKDAIKDADKSIVDGCRRSMKRANRFSSTKYAVQSPV